MGEVKGGYTFNSLFEKVLEIFILVIDKSGIRVTCDH
jgi:hypothetical protein